MHQVYYATTAYHSLSGFFKGRFLASVRLMELELRTEVPGTCILGESSPGDADAALGPSLGGIS